MSALSFPAPRINVYLNGRPTDLFSPARITDACGGGSLAVAHLRVMIDEPQMRARLSIPNAEIEIGIETDAADPDESAAERIVFWGKASGFISSTSDDESQTLEARQSPHHYGSPNRGMWEYNAKAGQHQQLPQTLIFNPSQSYASAVGARSLRGREAMVVRGNMTDTHPMGGAKVNVFLDPASVFTATARRYAIGSSERRPATPNESAITASDKKWDLKEIIYYLCWTLNDRETFIKNPTRDDLNLLDANTALVHDVEIPLGMTLPAALDHVLTQFGFGWRVDYIRRGVRTIAIHRRGVGVECRPRLQKPGENIDPNKSNISVIELAAGNTSLVNNVSALGDFKLYEATFRLYPAWSPSLEDGLVFEDLAEGGDAWKTRPELHRVYRDYVLNEANDYLRLRPEFSNVYDFAQIFGVPTVPRRRRFYPCISLDADRLPLGNNGFVVEFSDGTTDDSGNEWRAIEGFAILMNECGVRLEGDLPPEQVLHADFKLRITASVFSDGRITTQRSHRNSPQPDSVPVVLDVADRFHYREVHESSKHYDDVKARRKESSQADDSDRLQEFATQLVDSMDQLDVSGSLVVPSLNRGSFNLGDVVKHIPGRDYDFNIRAPIGPRYPQIVGIQYDCIQHRRILALESFRDARYR